MNQAKLRFIIKLLIWLVKTGQVKNAIKLIVWSIKVKIDFDKALARQDGSYYDRLVIEAAEDYNSRHEFKTSDPDFGKWLKDKPPA